MTLAIACGAVGSPWPTTARAETFSDPVFSAEVVTTLPPFLPVGVTWASDGRMFIWQRNGVIRLYKNGQLLPTPFLNISAQVNVFNDRGSLAFALHPNFLVNGFVYLVYVREEGGDPNDASPKVARLSRFTVDPQNPDVALASSETILLTIPNGFNHHSNGTLRFGADGKLFLGHGEDASAAGPVLEALVAQDLNDLRGKILRLNDDGTAPGDNPFDDGTNSIASKVYNYGLRNPFRFTLHPVSGEPYVGDVGWDSWEEFNRGRGKNFGWPCYEGMNEQPGYQLFFAAQCAHLTASVVTAPLLTYPHPGTPAASGAPIVGNAAIGGPFYTATLYPEVYRGNWFVADYAQGWIKRLVFDGAGTLLTTVPFATGLSGPVDLELGPDGMLYYVSIVTGQINRIRYNGPTAVASATPAAGHSPLSVTFSSAGSNDPNAGPLTYLWEFGDGQTSTAAHPLHVYASSTVQTFTATLTVTTNTSQVASATVKVTVGSLPPTATLQAPLNGTPVTIGQSIVYQGAATDPEDGDIPSAGLSWVILLHHNDHTHTQQFTTGPTGSVLIQNHGAGTYSYEFQLTATDTSGLTNVTTVTLPVVGDTTPPSSPTQLTATAENANRINLSWTPATDPGGGAVTYRVERCQGIGCTTFVQIATAVASPTYLDSGLLATTTYQYRVRAADAANNLSDYSTAASATTAALDTVPPTDPSGLTATASGSNQLNLAWTAATDNVGVTGYAIERCQGAGCTTFLQFATPVANAYSDTGLTPGITYSYRVRATDAAGNLSLNYSNIASATPEAISTLI
ncbi:MAG: PQQ-dependent sugar dehydrogenase, partial [Nitrospiraceae bacterium]